MHLYSLVIKRKNDYNENVEKAGNDMIDRLDIHGFTKAEAKLALDRFLKQVPSSIHEVVIIHGYHGGTRLKTFVRKGYQHPRLLRTMVNMNPGETIFVLK